MKKSTSVKKSMTANLGNDSPKRNYESRLAGHSTPIRKKEHTYDIEDSPELDYRCSPISLPCTQDGNEIAWDWQVPPIKNSNDKVKSQNSHIETPKRTKQLQKKRNSNSPLLQKPHKRKQVRMENIENIGKLTAELKALSERMKNMREKKEDDTRDELGSKLLIELDSESSDDAMVHVVDNDIPKINVIKVDSKKKKGSNYEDMFDDSIDDSMVKCSQEIEEKLNLCKSKGNTAMELSAVSEEKELSSMYEKETEHLRTTSNTSESSRNSNISKNSSSINSSGQLRTYSRNSNKNNSIYTAPIKNADDSGLRKTHTNNNIINVQSGKRMLQENSMSEFPDDSFDDCLATCMEDDKLLSKISEYDFNVSNTDHRVSHSRKNHKQTTSSTVKNKKISSNVAAKTEPPCDTASSSHRNYTLISDDLAENSNDTMWTLFSDKSALENRKFFKTKSLSDQYFHQNRNFNSSSKVNKTTVGGQASSKRIQSGSSSVSTNIPIVKSQIPSEGNHVTTNNSIDHARALNRLEETEAGNCIVKYKSTSNLSSIKEATKEWQSVQCTPEEIERKRREAKMKLEAKRKLQQSTRISATQSEVPVKKSVKR